MAQKNETSSEMGLVGPNFFVGREEHIVMMPLKAKNTIFYMSNVGI